jgi:predicted ATPase/DNA-binding winged helix-turn-helix (wHTH) protein
MQLTDKTLATVRFGQCQVRPHSGELLVGGVPAHLGRRAFDILMLLIEARGDLVTKDEILSRVWPKRVVEENTLQVRISSLRRALGKDRACLETLSGRGYRFVADFIEGGAAEVPSGQGAASSAPLPEARPLTNLSVSPSALIGREAEVALLIELATQHRLVTLTGAGGIGKTRLALEVARYLLPNFADGVWLAELGPLSNVDLVSDAVAAALGLEFAGGSVSPERVAKALGSKQLLLVLDNCEHVIDAAARLAETLVRASSAVHVLATSREPLRADGERVLRVQGLDVPAKGVEDMRTVLGHGAVRLFIERAGAADRQFSPERCVPAMATICRRLDGIPLAIELAAARAPMLGVEDLASGLDDRFRLLTCGYRTALPRHQTLRATLDWSYELLSDEERVVLGRLAVFAGNFSPASACAVAADSRIAASDVVAHVANLVAKSLVLADAGGAAAVDYRLLETTRAYALEKLAESGELDPVARRHAEHYRDLLEQAPAESQIRSSADWLAAYRRQIDNVRSALDWAFSPRGDAAIGVTLSAAAVPLMFELSLMGECSARSEQALCVAEAALTRDIPCEMRLRAALAAALVYTRGPGPETIAEWGVVLEMATELDDTEYQARALWGLWNAYIYGGAPRAGLTFARRFFELAQNAADAAKLLMGHRIIGISLHYLGDQSDARNHIQNMLARYVRTVHRWHTIGSRVDQSIVARATLARIVWLQGFPDQAIRISKTAVDDAQAYDHAMSTCYVLVEAAIPLSFMVGDLEAAERFLAMLRDQLSRHSFVIWEACARCFQAALLIRRGDVDAGLRRLSVALDELRETGFVAHLTAILAVQAEGLSDVGKVAAGLAVIDDAIARCERDEQRWCIADLLRIKGELALKESVPMRDSSPADYFLKALDWARHQGALSLELRAAMSLARLRHQQGRPSEAWNLLTSVYDRFREGFETADLKAAKALLVRLG